MKEIWKDIPDYEGLYQISNLGRVQSYYRTKKLLSIHLDRYGYYYVALCKKGKVIKKKIHRLLSITFIPNPNNHSDVHHIDGNKINNSLVNLEWIDGLYHNKISPKPRLFGKDHPGYKHGKYCKK